MTLRSANQWPVLEAAPRAVLVPGTLLRLTVRPGDVAVVLIEVARRFHAEVESLTEQRQRDDWGWAYRPVRGQEGGFSNHASGTAIDLNATEHPRGVKATFTRKQIAAVRRILAAMFDAPTGRSIVRWGEDYTTTVDGMHFEIDADAAAVARVANRILAKQAARDPLEEIMATPAERAALARETAALVAPRVVSQLTPALKALLARDEDGLYIRAEGTRPVYQVIGGVRIWVDGPDYEAAGRPEVQDLPAADPLLALRLVGQRPPAA